MDMSQVRAVEQIKYAYEIDCVLFAIEEMYQNIVPFSPIFVHPIFRTEPKEFDQIREFRARVGVILNKEHRVFEFTYDDSASELYLSQNEPFVGFYKTGLPILMRMEVDSDYEYAASSRR